MKYKIPAGNRINVCISNWSHMLSFCNGLIRKLEDYNKYYVIEIGISKNVQLYSTAARF